MRRHPPSRAKPRSDQLDLLPVARRLSPLLLVLVVLSDIMEQLASSLESCKPLCELKTSLTKFSEFDQLWPQLFNSANQWVDHLSFSGSSIVDQRR